MRPHARSRVSHDRWLVSYADFITLLFAFFVVLYAFARADQNKQIQVVRAIQKAVGIRPDEPTAVPEPSIVVTDENLLEPAAVREDLERIQRDLDQSLASQGADHTVAIEMGPDGLVISLREAGFFASGSAAPKPEALPTLRRIADSLGRTPYDIRVEGHTDNVPIHTGEFDSNWELSSARATHIARLFLELNAVPPERLSAAGYAEFHPAASNDTPEGRALNRRVDLVVMPRTKFSFAGPDGGQPTGPWRRITDEP